MRKPSRVPLAWLNLVESPAHLLTSVAGVAFAVVLMFLEMGFLQGLYDSQTGVAERLNADLVLLHPHKRTVVPTLPFPKSRLIQARGFAGVEAVYPVYLNEYRAVWKNSHNGREHPILVFGVNPGHPVFLIPEVVDRAQALKQPDTALIDARSKDFYGELVTGATGELAGRRIRIVGTFPLGPDFRVDGNLIVSDRTFFRCFPDPGTGHAEPEHVELGLIKLGSGADPAAVRRQLMEHLPPDVRVLTKQEFIQSIRDYWGDLQPVGYVFGLGMFVGFLIGVVICYQILFSDISRRLPQFAMVKALGYPDRYLMKVTLRQATYLALLGFAPGTLLSLIVCFALESYSGIVLRLTAVRILIVFAMTVAMCVAAGALAIRKVIRLDPAEVF